MLEASSWREIFGDTQRVPIGHPDLSWLDIPPPDFIRHAHERQALPFETIPCDPAQFRKEPTFILPQMHRLWQTGRAIHRHLPGGADTRLLDLGAFPFAVDNLLREYWGFPGRIEATANLPLAPEWEAILRGRDIGVSYVNCDAYVDSGEDLPDLPARLPFEDGSFDFVVLAHVIEHLYHPLPLLGEAFRVLRPGGRILVSTDNAFMLSTLFHLLELNDFVHEPVEQTAAMAFHFWRGHVRFFSEQDIVKILENTGFEVIESQLQQVYYNSFSDEYFRQPKTGLYGWEARLLREIPSYRNELCLTAAKPGPCVSGV